MEVCARKGPPAGRLMLLLDSEALSAIAHGPAARRDKIRALIVATTDSSDVNRLASYATRVVIADIR
jgi:hypothetical protein